jgi:hypothetical protein
VPFPEAAADTVRPPKGMTPSRFENRDKFYRKLVENSPVWTHGSSFQRESLLRSMDNAHRLLSSPAAKAFDLSLEPLGEHQKVRARLHAGQTVQLRQEPQRQLRIGKHRALRTRLFARAAFGGSRRALHRSHDRIHSRS